MEGGLPSSAHRVNVNTHTDGCGGIMAAAHPHPPAGRRAAASAAAGAAHVAGAPKGGGGVFKTAATTVLRQERRLMSTGEITRVALRLGLIGDLPGKTPDATMASAMYTDIKKGRAGKPGSVFCRPSEGMFGLRDWADDAALAHLVADAVAVTAPAAAGAASRGSQRAAAAARPRTPPLSPKLPERAAAAAGTSDRAKASAYASANARAAAAAAAASGALPSPPAPPVPPLVAPTPKAQRSGGARPRSAGGKRKGGPAERGGMLLLLEAAEALDTTRKTGPSAEETGSAGSTGDCGGGGHKQDTAASPLPKKARFYDSAPPPLQCEKAGTPSPLQAPTLLDPSHADAIRDLILMREQLVRLQTAFGQSSPVMARAIAEYAHAAHVRSHLPEADAALQMAWDVFHGCHSAGSLLDVRAGFERMLEEVAVSHLAGTQLQHAPPLTPTTPGAAPGSAQPLPPPPPPPSSQRHQDNATA